MYKSCGNCHDTVPMVDYDFTLGVCTSCLDKLHPKLALCKRCNGKKEFTYKISGGNKTWSERCKWCRGSGISP